MNFLERLLSNDSGLSALRFMSLVSLFIAGSITYIAIFMNKDLRDISTLVAIFVGAAFGGKVWQKYAENKTVKVKPNANKK